MTMPSAHYTFLRDGRSAAQAMLQQLGPLLELDTLWNGTPNYDGLITQAEIDSVTSLYEAGYTTTEIADAFYALSLIKTAITDHIAALARLSDLP